MAKSKRYVQRLAEYKRLAKKSDAQLRQIERYVRLSKLSSEQLVKAEKNLSSAKSVNQIKKAQKELALAKQNVSRYAKYGVLEKYAYGTAMKDISELYGGGSRFDRGAYKTVNGDRVDLTIDELNKRIESMQNFLSKPSAYLQKSKEHSSYPDALKRSSKAFSKAVTESLRDSGLIGKNKTINLSPDEIKDLMNMAEQYGLVDDYGKYESLNAIYTYQNNEKLKNAIDEIKKKHKNIKDEQQYKDIVSTEVKEASKKLGIGVDDSSVISTMVSNKVDFSKFITI